VKLVDEDGNPVTVPTGESVTVDVAWSGAAANATDASPLPTTVTISNGSQMTFVVDAIDDLYKEDPEALLATISNVVDVDGNFEAVAVGEENTANATITDESTPGTDDTVYAVISVNKETVEEGGKLTYTVKLVDEDGNAITVPTGESVTVDVAWSGAAANATDASPLPTTVTISNGSQMTFVVDAIDDLYKEDPEALLATISNVVDVDGNFEAVAVGTQNTANATITDEGIPGSDDTVFVVISSNGAVNEGEVSKFTVQLLDKDGNPVTVTQNTTVKVNFTNGSADDGDYQSGTQDVVITVGNSSVVVNVQTNVDQDLDDETFTATIESVNDGGQFEKVDHQSGINGQTPSALATINDVNTPPSNLTGTNTTISEEGLTSGIKDDTGTPSDKTDFATAKGSLTFQDQDTAADGPSQPFEFTLSGPTGITSGGETVTWAWDGINTLTGSTSNGVVATVTVGTVESNTGSHSADYDVTLLAPLTHPQNSVEDVLDLNFSYTVSDGTSSSATAGNFTVTVEDDMPVAADTIQTIDTPAVSTNLMISLDLSGSMQDASGVDGLSRLELAQKSLETLINKYDDLGSVKVRIVTFGTLAGTLGAGWLEADKAIELLNALNNSDADGWTNYDGALNVMQSAFETDGALPDGQNVSYFLSDGAPTASDGDDAVLGNTSADPGNADNNDDHGIQSTEEGLWQAFLDLNDINSISLGMGSNVSADALNPIAYNGSDFNNGDTDAVLVTDLTQLDQVLNDSINIAPVSGNLLTGNAGGFGGFGADGGYLEQVTLDVMVNGTSTSVTFTYDKTADNITNNSNVLGVISGSTLTVSTESGVFVLNMLDGSYQYQLADIKGYVDDLISYSLIDNDGDGASGSLSLKIGTPNLPVSEDFTVTFDSRSTSIDFSKDNGLASDSTIDGAEVSDVETLAADMKIVLVRLPDPDKGVLYFTEGNVRSLVTEAMLETASTDGKRFSVTQLEYDVNPNYPTTVNFGETGAQGAGDLSNWGNLVTSDTRKVTLVNNGEIVIKAVGGDLVTSVADAGHRGGGLGVNSDGEIDENNEKIIFSINDGSATASNIQLKLNGLGGNFIDDGVVPGTDNSTARVEIKLYSKNAAGELVLINANTDAVDIQVDGNNDLEIRPDGSIWISNNDSQDNSNGNVGNLLRTVTLTAKPGVEIAQVEVGLAGEGSFEIAGVDINYNLNDSFDYLPVDGADNVGTDIGGDAVSTVNLEIVPPISFDIVGANIDVDTYVYNNGTVVSKQVHEHAYDTRDGYDGFVDAFNFISKDSFAEIDDAVSADYFVLMVINGHRNAATNILIDTAGNPVQATDAFAYGGGTGFDAQVYTLQSGKASGDQVKKLEGLKISFDENSIITPDANGNYPDPDNSGDYLDSDLSYGIRMTETGRVNKDLHGTQSPADEHRDGALSIWAVEVTKNADGSFNYPELTYGGISSDPVNNPAPYIVALADADQSSMLWETTVFAHTSGDDPRRDQEYIDNTHANGDAINTGMFVDGIVEGLAYSTNSGFSGITDAKGGFKYLNGDLITFSIGNVVIGTVSSAAVADGTLFLQEIAGVGLEDMNNDYVENMAVLLQSLDNDGDAYNGIVIEQSVHDAFSDDNFDMAATSKADLQSLLIENGYQPVDEDAAMQHVRDMIELQTGLTEFDERTSLTNLFASDEDDIFTVTAAETGEKGEDIAIIGFGEKGNDALDLSDLLSMQDNGDDLSSYLNVSFDGENTLIEVSASGSFADQQADASQIDQAISLQGVDLIGGIDNVDTVIQGLLDNGNLIIDE
ncbi:MAG: type I secretion C-terminal target domain-containing protein, partial [Pseudomonadales bacterium]|nr:type I secretion C-terminal target domain-containing protein [Pseudomonadales bacterium]